MQHTSPEGRGHCTAQNTASEGRGHCTAQQIAPGGRGHCTAQHTALHHAESSLGVIALHKILRQGALRCATYCTMQRAGGIALRNYILHQGPGGWGQCNTPNPLVQYALRNILHQGLGALHCATYCTRGWGHCTPQHIAPGAGGIALRNILQSAGSQS